MRVIERDEADFISLTEMVARQRKRFSVTVEDIFRGGYDLCFPLIDLYRNQIEHRESIEAAA